MIPDKLFKSLDHKCSQYKMYSNGQKLEEGYFPDYVLKKSSNEYIIMESEYNTNRKMYLGGMIKAAHFLQNQKKGILIFVIKHQKNTRPESIASHLKKYFKFINNYTNLKQVYVIDSNVYYSKNKVLPIDSNCFNEKSYKVLNY